MPLLIIAACLLVAGCADLSGYATSGPIPSTSYQSGYGIRPNGPQSAADSQMDWGW
ncbi:hypothetical protein [Azospirillum doebereinerae]|uniref:hypothetical protein n=1 Tax=Azospirillum doebereinerae TaxID=92933 RepID=UPI00163CD693|nr:hypothetical protein [Azospirillum doebereinerae]MCG5243013.1 hypothetical protein [Azospirillum doebereinerae]